MVIVQTINLAVEKLVSMVIVQTVNLMVENLVSMVTVQTVNLTVENLVSMVIAQDILSHSGESGFHGNCTECLVSWWKIWFPW